MPSTQRKETVKTKPLNFICVGRLMEPYLNKKKNVGLLNDLVILQSNTSIFSEHFSAKPADVQNLKLH